MEIKTGIDLVHLPTFRKTLKRGGVNFLKKLYLPQELTNTQITHLAGLFAAKEAIMKALDLPPDSWHAIKIVNSPSGKPEVKLPHYALKLESHSLSISHHGNYVIAQFVGLVRK